jgi:GntR family histidine utilization transcriptional repressor
MDLFPDHPDAARKRPLAARMRPLTLDEIVGQRHILAPGKLLRRAIEADRLDSLILYGPPGCGKTSLAEVIALTTRRAFSRAGSGSSVAPPRAAGALLALRDIAQELAGGAAPHVMDVISHAVITASPRAAALFAAEPGLKLIRVVVRHSRGQEPLLIEDRLIDPAVAPGAAEADFSRITTYAFLTRAAPLQDIEHTVRAINAGPALARQLAVAPGAACLEIRRRTWSAGRIASAARLTYAGERYELTGHPARPSEGDLP